ncbi:PREDICTED: ephexin-1 [Ceratosolen solmsi marchali]|uniref:Ephexin-1 n=1 Tax=Ceratosolen solmsi marchali TaxID=326594 RepID=A0AAJ6YMS8_9HYME|nr:PREDICTED: ephexin-1 [Ceratosolen solmsi marchali]
MTGPGPLANRSFLYGERQSRLVYASLDGLALSRASLPLRLPPNDSPANPKIADEPPAPKDEEVVEGEEENEEEVEGEEENEENEEENVLHYVPVTSRRYYRKSRKLASKSLSLKSLGVWPDRSQTAGPRCRSLSRDELRSLSISAPSNFVHVASATRGDGFPWARLDDDDHYDDVGPPEAVTETAEIVDGDEVVEGPQLDAYDDVGPLGSSSPEEPYDAESVYDDVMPAHAVNCDEDVYDDVDLPPRQECHERVNSLYGGSSASGSLHAGHQDKESEWEDLEEVTLQQLDDFGSKVTQEPSSPTKKKLVGGQRWLRKVRRQRSRASRKSSGRSTSRGPTRDTPVSEDRTYSGRRLVKAPVSHGRDAAARAPENLGKSAATRDHETAMRQSLKTPSRRPNTQVTLSLGQGSILLLGWSEEVPQPEQPRHEVKGLVQLRLVLAEEHDELEEVEAEEAVELQEASVYVAEDSSDDSNYETLETYEPDDFSSDSGSEAPSACPQEAPERAVPPPPREASLGYSLGRRMKMLRRTWSITKGSLGRMRRRAVGECEAPAESTIAGDAKKYFSFKKHFRKNQASGLSTFYLDKAASPASIDERRDDKLGQEPVYTNGNWYREAGLYRNQRSSKSQEVPVDHYSVLAEEPLYQFYAAAATRVAFESDSDGYEEVEELTPSTATTDLAKPGHRTLWCQTPQVINSGLLQSLSSEERKIQEAKFEILTSEASYLNSLRVLENEFASNYELAQEVLTSAERERLFGSVPDVLVASERFLAELESIWREDPMLARLPELLLRHSERCSGVYVDYCSNQVSIDTTLKELRSKKGYKFIETVSRIESHPTCQSLSLHSFLMLPMQRITRLPLLADAILSRLAVEHSERLSWERVLAALSHVVGKCNEGARLAERRNEMDALARKLEYSSKVPPISLHDRELIRSGTVVQLSTKSDSEYKLTFGKKFHKTPLLLMLLTDYLLVTKLKSNSNDETYSVIETCKRSLVALESAPEDAAPLAGRHAMVLTLLENQAGRQVEYVLTCESDTERERWLDAVSPPKPSCVGETLYESWDCPQVMALYSYVPRQPDELALQPGDVINVLRKMNDGWLFGEKLLDGEQGWFPGNFTKEVASEHVRARNLRQRHRFLALSGSVLQRRAKQSLSIL